MKMKSPQRFFGGEWRLVRFVAIREELVGEMVRFASAALFFRISCDIAIAQLALPGAAFNSEWLRKSFAFPGVA